MGHFAGRPEQIDRESGRPLGTVAWIVTSASGPHRTASASGHSTSRPSIPTPGEHPGKPKLYLPGGVEHDGRHGAGRVVVDAVAEHDIEPEPSLPVRSHRTRNSVRSTSRSWILIAVASAFGSVNRTPRWSV